MRKFIMSVAAVLLMASSLSTMAKAAEEVSIPFGAFWVQTGVFKSFGVNSKAVYEAFVDGARDGFGHLQLLGPVLVPIESRRDATRFPEDRLGIERHSRELSAHFGKGLSSLLKKGATAGLSSSASWSAT